MNGIEANRGHGRLRGNFAAGQSRRRKRPTFNVRRPTSDCPTSELRRFGTAVFRVSRVHASPSPGAGHYPRRKGASPEGTAEVQSHSPSFSRPFGTCVPCAMFPGVQTPGYSQNVPPGQRNLVAAFSAKNATRFPSDALKARFRCPAWGCGTRSCLRCPAKKMWTCSAPEEEGRGEGERFSNLIFSYSLEHFRFSSFISFGKGRVLITSALASQPLRAMPAPRRRKPACSLRCASQLMTHLTPFDFA